MKYKFKLLLGFMAIFAVFTALLVLFQLNRERQYKRELIEARLQSYADIVAGEMVHAHDVQHPLQVDSMAMNGLVADFPQELRLTIIRRSGKVAYESGHHSRQTMGNHNGRPEVAAAWRHGIGSDVRYSQTDHLTYFYLAKAYDEQVVRVALPYDATVKDFMKGDNVFLWFVLMLLPIALVSLIYVADRMGKAVTSLRTFMQAADKGLVDYDRIRFPRSELGDIGRGIMEKYRQIENSNRCIAAERERLVRHFHYFDEGIAIFSASREVMYANPRFLLYMDTLLDKPSADIQAMWQADAFAELTDFLNLHGGPRMAATDAPVLRYITRSGSASYHVQLLIYTDGGFEITLTDVTRIETNKLLKQQMSNNITHELRTPVSSIRGYMETILDGPALTEEKRLYFLKKAYAQVVRLTDLIRDVALITKTEEAAELMPRERVNMNRLVIDVEEELDTMIQDMQAVVQVNLPSDLWINGNYSLLYAIVRNLLENSLRYAGKGAKISLNCYNVADGTAYFSFYDNGTGVPQEHLSRLFERFYRVAEGRSRENGGTGLGLSIVRNAVCFHQGDISVRNRKEGGLEFLFTLHL